MKKWDGLLPDNCIDCNRKLYGIAQVVGKKKRTVVCLKCAQKHGIQIGGEKQ